MFNYESFEEATAMKERITDVVFSEHDSVVSVGTEQDHSNGSIVYSVKIGLKDSRDEEECNKILKTLSNAHLLSESLDSINHAQKKSLFKHIGLISAQSSSSVNLTFMNMYRGIPKSGLAVAALAGTVGLAACIYRNNK